MRAARVTCTASAAAAMHDVAANAAAAPRDVATREPTSRNRGGADGAMARQPRARRASSRARAGAHRTPHRRPSRDARHHHPSHDPRGASSTASLDDSTPLVRSRPRARRAVQRYIRPVRTSPSPAFARASVASLTEASARVATVTLARVHTARRVRVDARVARAVRWRRRGARHRPTLVRAFG